MYPAAPPGRLSDLAFWLLWGFVRTAFAVLFRLRIEGAPPAGGAYVLAANHASYLDPAFVQLVVRRRVTFVMTEDFYRSKWGSWFYKLVGAVPIGRGDRGRALPRSP